MKLSEYISKLQDIVNIHGDIDCVTWTDNIDLDSTTQGWFDGYNGDSTEHLSTFACTYLDRDGNKHYADTNSIGYVDCRKETVFVVFRD